MPRFWRPARRPAIDWLWLLPGLGVLWAPAIAAQGAPAVVREAAARAFGEVDTLAHPADPFLAAKVTDGIFAYLLGLRDREQYGVATGAHLAHVLAVTGTKSSVPHRLVREIRRAPAGGSAAWARAVFVADLEFPVPYSILGYHPGSLLASQETLFEERHYERLSIPNPDPQGDVTIELTDVTLWSLVAGEIIIDIDGWVDALLGGRLDDTYVVGLADFRYEGERLAMAMGFNRDGEGRSGALDLTRNQIRFPAPSEMKAIGRSLRARVIGNLGRLRVPAWVPPDRRDRDTD